MTNFEYKLKKLLEMYNNLSVKNDVPTLIKREEFLKLADEICDYVSDLEKGKSEDSEDNDS